MPGLVHLSDAVCLGFHSAVLIATLHGQVLGTPEIARRLKVSEHHLQKVHAAMKRAGLLVSQRGPHGGWRLARAPEKITLLPDGYNAGAWGAIGLARETERKVESGE